MTIEDSETLETIPAADRAKLEAAGFRPVLRWRRRNIVCATGEALQEIKLEAKRAACAHVRGGASDYCGKCGAILPWARQ